MGREVLSEGTSLTPTSVSKCSSAINDLLKNWFEHIPEEIIHSILVRLPIESLVRCTSICKSWRAIIKHPRFMLIHLTHTQKSNDQNDTHLMLLNTMFNQETVTYTLHFDNQCFDQYCKVELPIGLKEIMVNDNYRVVGTCNGLICLADDLGRYDSNFGLWNPFVRKYVILPKPSVRLSTHGGYDACIGMGYDARNNDYKVVRVVTLLHQGGAFEDFRTLAQVYSLTKGTWGKLLSDLPPCFMNGRCFGQVFYGEAQPDNILQVATMVQAFVNGAVHLLVLRQMGNDFAYYVLTFDVSSEAFGEIMLPKRFIFQDTPEKTLELKLSVTGDEKSIGLFVWFRIGADAFLDIWAMKEYGVEKSWTKLIILTPQGPNRSSYQALCFRKSGEVVLLVQDSSEVFALDLVNKQFKCLGVSRGWCFKAYSYEESLVLLDRLDTVSY
ncbi:hypothetical protein OROHE_018822 [Orobanche hederae]